MSGYEELGYLGFSSKTFFSSMRFQNKTLLSPKLPHETFYNS